MSVCLLVLVVWLVLVLVVWLVLVDSLVHQCHVSHTSMPCVSCINAMCLIHQCHVSHACRYSAFVLILSMLCVEKPCISAGQVLSRDPPTGINLEALKV